MLRSGREKRSIGGLGARTTRFVLHSLTDAMKLILMFRLSREKTMLLFVLIFLLPAMSGFFKPGFYAAHDAVWHIARFWQFHLSFETGQIPVRWAPTLLYGLGYPAFIVNFHLPYYLMEIIYRFGPGLV